MRSADRPGQARPRHRHHYAAGHAAPGRQGGADRTSAKASAPVLPQDDAASRRERVWAPGPTTGVRATMSFLARTRASYSSAKDPARIVALPSYRRTPPPKRSVIGRARAPRGRRNSVRPRCRHRAGSERGGLTALRHPRGGPRRRAQALVRDGHGTPCRLGRTSTAAGIPRRSPQRSSRTGSHGAGVGQDRSGDGEPTAGIDRAGVATAVAERDRRREAPS